MTMQIMTDEEIAESYRDFTIGEHGTHTKRSGFIEIIFPYRESVVDNFIRYNNNRIAFDNWYPKKIHQQLLGIAHKVLDGGNIFTSHLLKDSAVIFCSGNYCSDSTIKKGNRFYRMDDSIFCTICFKEMEYQGK